MESPVLVTIDLQHDFYHPEGSYGQRNRPLEPIRAVTQFLQPIISRHHSVLRIQSLYSEGQFSDMPNLCLSDTQGARWHPELRKGPLLTKHEHSGFPALREFFETSVPVVLAGVCTHRCVKATLNDLIKRGWSARILDGGVASCGLRQPKHERCMERWRRRGLTIQPYELFDDTDWTTETELPTTESNDDVISQTHSRRPM